MKTVHMLLMIGLAVLTHQGILTAQTYTFPGSVGINTLNPERTLHIEGDVLISGPESLMYVDRFGGPSSGLAVFSSENPDPHTSDGCTIKTVVCQCSMGISRPGILARRKNFALGLRMLQNLPSWMAMSAWAR